MLSASSVSRRDKKRSNFSYRLKWVRHYKPSLQLAKPFNFSFFSKQQWSFGTPLRTLPDYLIHLDCIWICYEIINKLQFENNHILFKKTNKYWSVIKLQVKNKEISLKKDKSATGTLLPTRTAAAIFYESGKFSCFCRFCFCFLATNKLKSWIMASKRIAQSAVNWGAMAEKVGEAQRPMFNAFKLKSDAYLRK